MELIVCGSRNWTNYELMNSVLRDIAVEQSRYKGIVTLIHGGASGADMMAGHIAKEISRDYAWVVKVFPADWKRYGRSAGMIRNKQMLEQKPDLVLAFWDGHSRGTRNMIELAKFTDIPVQVYRS